MWDSGVGIWGVMGRIRVGRGLGLIGGRLWGLGCCWGMGGGECRGFGNGGEG